MSDIDDKLNEMHKDLRDTRDSLTRKMETQEELARENLQIQHSIRSILVSLRDNTWHQFQIIRGHLLDFIKYVKGD
jgi:hypothetical protein